MKKGVFNPTMYDGGARGRGARKTPLPPVSVGKGAFAGVTQMVEPPKIGEEMQRPSFPQIYPDQEPMMIDPNLLVGPLYESGTRRQDAIKEQLGDITSKLHRTLDTFDEMESMGPIDDPLDMMKKKIRDLEDKDMQSHLVNFMDRFEDMSHQVSEANQERDEMLLQLADWFTTDHVDLEDIKTSLDETDEQSIKESYFSTMTTFEKLKKIQTQIMTNDNRSSVRQLEQKKIELEKSAIDSFKNMKDMSVQTFKVQDDAPWKYAANEIVSMLKNVRTENKSELEAIAKNMQEMVKQLEKQALTIKSLTAELRDKKEMVQRLTNENGDLTQDCAALRAQSMRYERELINAKELIKTLGMQKAAQAQGVTLQPAVFPTHATDYGLSPARSSLQPNEKQDPGEVDVHRLGSEPALLRTQVRGLSNDLDHMKSEFSRVSEELEELQCDMQEKKAYIDTIEEENEKFVRDLRRLRDERRKSIAAIEAASGDGHTCEHCQCHKPRDKLSPTMEEEEHLRDEVKRLTDRCAYYKKALADTEMKLSDAYKEISDLRMMRDEQPVRETKVTQPPKKREKKEEVKPKPPPEKKERPKLKPSKPSSEALAAQDADSQEPKAKPRPHVKSRYMESKPRQEMAKLPPIESKLPPQPPDPKHSREFDLYKVGDLQGRLNMLLSEVMEFVGEIGRLLYTEKEDDKKVQNMKAFDFADQVRQTKRKDLQDAKDQEAKQKKSQVIFSGQHACGKLREAFDMLSHSLELQHDEYEAIYRSFKISQQRNAIRKEIMMGRMAPNALKEFDMQFLRNNDSMGSSLLQAYYKISYGGTVGLDMKNKGRPGTQGRSSSKSTVGSASSETEARLKGNFQILGIQRSKSDLDVRTTEMFQTSALGTGLLREKSSLYLTNVPDNGRRESTATTNKQEVKIAKAVVPGRGLIQLTSIDSPFQVNKTGETRPDSDLPSTKSGPKGLIKRKDILAQIKQGTKLLEESEKIKSQEDEMVKTLGEYTMLDLQSHIFQMTDSSNLRRQTEVPVESGEEAAEKKKKNTGVTLPAINNLKIF